MKNDKHTSKKCSNCKWTTHTDYCDVDLPPWVAAYLGERNFPALWELEEGNTGKYCVFWEPKE